MCSLSAQKFKLKLNGGLPEPQPDFFKYTSSISVRFNVIFTLFSMPLGGFSEDYLALYKTAFVQNTLCARQLNYTEVLLQPRFRKCKTCVNILGRSQCSFVVRNDEKPRQHFPI